MGRGGRADGDPRGALDLRCRRARDGAGAALTASTARGLGAAALAAVGLGLLAVVLRGADPATARALASEARWGWAGVALVGFAANHALRILRWHVLLDAPVPMQRQATLCLVGFLAITTLPLRLGEVVRPALLAREGVPLGRTLAALVVERVLDLLALLALLLWVAVVPELPAVEVDGVDVLGLGRRAAGVAVAGLVLGLLVVTAVGDRLGAVPVAGPTARAMAAAGRELAGRPGRGLAGAALTVAIWAAILAYVGAGAAVIPSLPRSVEAVAVVWSSVMATITVLPTPGFFGSYEAGAVAALSLYGVDGARAGVWALGLHAAYLAFVAALGLPATLWLRRRTPDCST